MVRFWRAMNQTMQANECCARLEAREHVEVERVGQVAAHHEAGRRSRSTWAADSPARRASPVHRTFGHSRPKPCPALPCPAPVPPVPSAEGAQLTCPNIVRRVSTTAFTRLLQMPSAQSATLSAPCRFAVYQSQKADTCGRARQWRSRERALGSDCFEHLLTLVVLVGRGTGAIDEEFAFTYILYSYCTRK